MIISDYKEWMYLLGLAWRNFQTGVIVQLESTINILRQILNLNRYASGIIRVRLSCLQSYKSICLPVSLCPPDLTIDCNHQSVCKFPGLTPDYQSPSCKSTFVLPFSLCKEKIRQQDHRYTSSGRIASLWLGNTSSCNA